MGTILLAYSTWNGQTRRIAERIAATLRGSGRTVDVVEVAAGGPAQIDMARYDAAIVAASIRMGKHAPPIVAFVRQHRDRLAAIPNMFITVSLSAYGVVDPTANADRKRRAGAEVEKTIARFVKDTGWTPNETHSVAGALLYLQYGFFLRMLMRFISGVVGASTDMSRNHEYTDWAAVERCANEFAARCEVKAGAAGETPKRLATAR
ncbi:MAG: flavodoxin domain-containing protein [Burkholderiales bacterium]